MSILLLIAIVILYGHLGYRLKKNYILWGLLGLAIYMGPALLVILANLIFSSHFLMLAFWPIALLAGPIFSVVTAGVIVYRNNGAFKRPSPAGKKSSENPNS